MMTRTFFTLVLMVWGWVAAATAQEADQALSDIQALMQEHRETIVKSSRQSIGPAIDALANSGLPAAANVLEKWQDKDLWLNEADGLFYFVSGEEDDIVSLVDIATGEDAGTAPDDVMDQMKPNAGIRRLIGSALVQFQLNDPNPESRRAALDAIGRRSEESHLPVLRASIDNEPDARIKAAKARLERILTISYGADDAERIEAINYFEGDLSVDVRAALNPLVVTEIEAVAGEVPDAPDVAGTLTPGDDGFSAFDAYAVLVDQGFARPRISRAEQKDALIANIEGGQVAGIEVASLDTPEARDAAYEALAQAGAVEALATDDDALAMLDDYSFVERYTNPSPMVAVAAAEALKAIDQKVWLNQILDLMLDALSLGSIYFLAAIGLAITFGVMRVINMAHGEFIMMGAYTGYVVQQVIPDYTTSLIVALPLAFVVTFMAGVAMERLVIRWLYHRPLETLLATFGISIALQQMAKNIFGTQARPLTSPDWLAGAYQLNDVVSISYVRIAIFVMAIVFLCLILVIMNRTRLGMEVRAVTQNPRMAASMGINTDRINMLTFGLGSGIAGVAGLVIGLYAKVTSEMGADYIVQSFMTVVVGGVGNIWGTLLGAGLVGVLQKGIEWFNPSNTLAAQTYMILFIILFIQFRPRGIIALKGRAAEA